MGQNMDRFYQFIAVDARYIQTETLPTPDRRIAFRDRIIGRDRASGPRSSLPDDCTCNPSKTPTGHERLTIAFLRE
jgi:hypothetical protein